MLIEIGGYDFTEVWDGVLYKKLAHYPIVSEWEKRTLAEFALYEAQHGRTCSLECEDGRVLAEIQAVLTMPEKYLQVPLPEKICECTACRQGGCLTGWVCHTASPENAVKIFQSGSLLSAVKARNLPAEVLMAEDRNAASDPADYFHYVMLSWGNCQAGDRLVTERRLGRFPTEKDLAEDFTPGVRFYFRYERLSKHPGVVFDGVLPMKIRDEIVLADWAEYIVIPACLKEEMLLHIPDGLQGRILFADSSGLDIWAWSEKVYQMIEREWEETV